MINALEARLDALEEQVKSLTADLKNKEAKLRELEDIEAIKRLQCAYGYYLEHWMSDEIIDCFSRSPDVSATFVEGTYYGLEGVRRYFKRDSDQPPTFLHQVMQVSPVITLDAEGVHAKGRWYGYGSILSRPTQPLDPILMAVTYEMEYIKEDGAWKILKLALLLHFAYSQRTTGQGQPVDETGEPRRLELNPDEWAEFSTQYPSGYIYPMHFVHPVTGKPSSEAKRNARLKLKPNPFRPQEK